MDVQFPDEPAIPSIEQIEKICALQDPVLRNLLITYTYHQLSDGLQVLLQDPNINWCTFATWASRQAGVTIRNEELPKFLVDKWNQDARLERALIQAHPSPLDLLEEKLLFPFLDAVLRCIKHTTLGTHIEKTVSDVSGSIARGNLKVFKELAPHFALLIKTFEQDTKFNKAKIDKFVSKFRSGPAAEEGQDLLKEAFTHYARAVFEKDGKKKAERILLANIQVGLHEQTRLQPEIGEALNAPIRDTVGARLQIIVKQFAPDGIQQKLLRLFDPLLEEVDDFWRIEATRHMMTLKLGDEILDLGAAFVAADGQSLYPEDLGRLLEEELVAFMVEHYTLWDPEKQHVVREPGTADWANLVERMDYIICLFRSRQQRSGLTACPFSPDQVEMLKAGHIPVGPL